MKVILRKGDTLTYLSKIFLLDQQLIVDANESIDSDNLQLNTKVVIPGYKEQIYTPKSNETIQKLANRFHVPVDALLLLNPTIDPHYPVVGETIKIPQKISHYTIQSNYNYDSNKLAEDIVKLKSNFPFININIVGKSVMQKPIYGITIGRGNKKIQINGSFHANEWITTPILMKLVNEYLLAITNNWQVACKSVEKYYSSTQLVIVPMVNPDGVDLVLNGPPAKLKKSLLAINRGNPDFSAWKANIRGVDLNNQFPANWEIEKKRKEPKQPAPRDYPGDSPLTEPEAVAMAKLAEQIDFSLLLALHTQGEEFYWGYEGFEHEKASKIAAEFAKVSNYEAVKFIDSHAGYRDWFIKKFRQPGFTLELGKGVNPLPLSQFNKMYTAMRAIFLVALDS